MKLIGYKSFLLVLFFFTCSFHYGQEANIDTEVDSSKASWKPFTIELNSSVFGKGIALEKGILEKLFLRTSFATNFREFPTEYISYKVGVGALYNFFDSNRISFRSGLNFGIRQLASSKQAIWSSGGIGNLDPIIFSYFETPLIVQIRLFDNCSIDIGVSSLFQKQVDSIADFFNPLSSPSVPNENGVRLSYLLALRYTFSD